MKNKYPSESVVTVNTDASYDPNTKTGGWGCWIKSDFFTIKKGGQFLHPVIDSNESEIKALVNAFHILKNTNMRFKVAIVNCDNSTARNIINTKKVPDRFKKEGNILLSLISEYEMCLAKHIKGHKHNYNSRQWVNNWCDKASKQYRYQNA